ncbi:phosphoribosyl-ATP diphosphatase [bacterium]|nr:phosphoribosyl-ATP diphosphatase [bacterium]
MIDKLYQVICERRDHPQPESYVSSLIEKGTDKILQKVGEEATEVILATKNLTPDIPASAEALIHEIADLTFHVMVLMAEQEIPPAAIAQELKRRFGISGLEEKANR